MSVYNYRCAKNPLNLINKTLSQMVLIRNLCLFLYFLELVFLNRLEHSKISFIYGKSKKNHRKLEKISGGCRWSIGLSHLYKWALLAPLLVWDLKAKERKSLSFLPLITYIIYT
jgi:hypothetical protein